MTYKKIDKISWKDLNWMTMQDAPISGPFYIEMLPYIDLTTLPQTICSQKYTRHFQSFSRLIIKKK